MPDNQATDAFGKMLNLFGGHLVFSLATIDLLIQKGLITQKELEQSLEKATAKTKLSAENQEIIDAAYSILKDLNNGSK